MAPVEIKAYDLHIVIAPEEEIPGQWYAFCPELDVVTQGNSLRHAIDMAREAIELTVIDDLSKGWDPLRRRAPEEEWAEMWQRLNSAVPVSLDSVVDRSPNYVVLESVLTITRLSKEDIAQAVAGVSPLPPAAFQVPVAFVPRAA